MLNILIWLCFLSATNIGAGPLWNKYLHYLEDPAVDRFREYLRIDTSKEENLSRGKWGGFVHREHSYNGHNSNTQHSGAFVSLYVMPTHTRNLTAEWLTSAAAGFNVTGRYLHVFASRSAVEFWIRQSKVLGLPYAIYEPSGKPIFVATWEGTDPSLPSIMLNSHMDVVKAEEEEWSYPPFEAYMDENGDIYGRGTQDTKDVGILYLEAIRRLKKENITLARTLHVTVMPDEETGGKKGMRAFVKTAQFKALNIGFALDEGLTTAGDTLLPSFVDKRAWQMEFEIRGEGGHGYMMPDNSAMANMYKFINAVMAYRDTQKQILKQNADNAAGYSSLNINVIDGGLAVNIIPSHFTLIIDLRLATDAVPEEVQSMVNSWMSAASNETKVKYIRRETRSAITSVDGSNPYWVSMTNTLDDIGMKYKPVVLPATSDAIVLRNMGIPAIGFSAKIHTISRQHSKDEYQNVEIFLRGIDIYTEIIKNLGNVPRF